MATVMLKRVRTFGPDAAGTLMTPREFDRADFRDGWRYELIHGVLVVPLFPWKKRRIQTRSWDTGSARIAIPTRRGLPWMRPCRS